MGFAVVTDSTADISPEMAATHAIEVVPLSVTISGETVPDGTWGQAEFFRRMDAAPQLPTTSQPSVGDFIEVYERVLGRADEILSIHISNKLSGTIESARQAAENFAGRVHVFDSLNLSWGLAWQVREAAVMATRQASIDKALAHLHDVRKRTRLIVGIDSLENLSKGGRIGKVSALLGAMLDLKVTFTVDADGAFAPVARSRGEKAALRRTLDWVGEQLQGTGAANFAVGYAMRPERAHWLAEQIRQRFNVGEVVIYEAGSVITTHTGTGWGVAVLPDPSS